MSVMLRTEIARLRSLLAEAREAFIYDRPHWSPSGGHNLNPTGGYDSPWPKDCVVCVMLAKLDAELGMAAGENDAASGPGSGVTPDHVPASITQAATPAAPDHAEPVTEFTDEQLVRELNRRLVPCREGHRAELLCLWPCWRCKVAEELAKAGDLRYVTVSEDSLLRLAEIAVQESDEDNETSSSAVVAARALERWRREREGRC